MSVIRLILLAKLIYKLYRFYCLPDMLLSLVMIHEWVCLFFGNFYLKHERYFLRGENILNSFNPLVNCFICKIFCKSKKLLKFLINVFLVFIALCFLPFIGLYWIQPESPKWLVSVGKCIYILGPLDCIGCRLFYLFLFLKGLYA